MMNAFETNCSYCLDMPSRFSKKTFKANYFDTWVVMGFFFIYFLTFQINLLTIIKTQIFGVGSDIFTKGDTTPVLKLNFIKFTL